MSLLPIISSWKNNIFKPVYWLEGEEDFFIDEIVSYAEKKILSEADAAFNLTIFYGKDADWSSVINACRRYPMFAERQVVLLKEAQQMKDIDKLEPYLTQPLSSTVLVVAHKGKTLDGRSKLAKVIKQYGELFLSKKIYENQLPAWVQQFVQAKGIQISSRALNLLVDHVGNDLSRMVNEINKLTVNLTTNMITENEIEKFIGISKEYNIFEFQKALSEKDPAKAIRMIQYFEANPKAVPVQLLIPSLYGYFTKIMTAMQLTDRSDRALRPVFYNNPFLVEQALTTMRNYSFMQLEGIVILLHEYNLKSIGINSFGTTPASLMKELTYKIIHA